MELPGNKKIRICIIENDFVIQETLEVLLAEAGYHVAGIASNESDAMLMLEKHQPDLALLDIGLNKQHGGIDVARFIRDKMDIPFIYITGNSDKTTLSKAKETNPDAYLLKPFRKEEVSIAIEVALQNFNDRKKQNPDDVLFIKDGGKKHKIIISDILYVESQHVYISIVTEQARLIIRDTLTEFATQLPPKQFIRVHRSYLVNIKKIQKIVGQDIYIAGNKIPISKTYRAEVDRAIQGFT